MIRRRAVSPRFRSYTVSIRQYNYLRQITKDLSNADYKLFCHILVSTISNFRQQQENHKGWIPIKARFVQATFHNARPENLRCHGLIDIDCQYVAGRHPRRYRLKDWVLDAYVQASLADTEPGRRLVGIVTGKPLPKRPPESLPDGPAMPPLVRRAIERFRVCYFDRPTILEHLHRLRAAHEKTSNTRNKFRLLNDWFIFDVIDKLAEPTDTPGVYCFKPQYMLQSTGRIGTPLQSASRAMKEAAYGSLEGIHNYDLSSSQMALCLREMKRHGISCPWLEEYLNEPTKRTEHSRSVGVSIDTWKTCLYTVLMTGHIPTNTAWQGSPVVEALAEDITAPDELKDTLKRLREVLKPLARSLKHWHKIVESEARESGQVKNMLGTVRPYHDFGKTSGMVAHLLQGAEAYFIHTLTLLADKHGFEPLGNEHDGIISWVRYQMRRFKRPKPSRGWIVWSCGRNRFVSPTSYKSHQPDFLNVRRSCRACLESLLKKKSA